MIVGRWCGGGCRSSGRRHWRLSRGICAGPLGTCVSQTPSIRGHTRHTDGECALSRRSPGNVGFITSSRGPCSCERNDSRVRTDDQRFYTVRTACRSCSWRRTAPQPSRYCKRAASIVQRRRRVFGSSRGGQRGGHGKRSCMHFESWCVVLRVCSAQAALQSSYVSYCCDIVCWLRSRSVEAEIRRVPCSSNTLAQGTSFTGSTAPRKSVTEITGSTQTITVALAPFNFEWF